MSAYVFVHPISKSPFESETSSRLRFLLTEYIIPKDQSFNLLSGSKEEVSIGTIVN